MEWSRYGVDISVTVPYLLQNLSRVVSRVMQSTDEHWSELGLNYDEFCRIGFGSGL